MSHLESSAARISLVLLTGLLGCTEVTNPDERGGRIALDIVLEDGAGAARIDEGRIVIEGPTSRTLSVAPGSTTTITDLAPGTYTVTLEGLTAGEVETFGERTGVSVSAGVNTNASVTMSSFLTSVSPLPPLVEIGEDITVQFTAVPNATSYVVEWATNPGFTNAQSTTTSNTAVAIRPNTAGVYYVRVRARNRLGSNGRAAAAGPVDVPVAAVPTDQRSIATGGNYSCALDRAGIAYCWGSGTNGALGTGNTGSSATPVPVAGGHSFVSISAGITGTFTCAMDRAGRAYCWGTGTSGQLGAGDFESSTSPREVAGGHSFVSLNSSSSHTCAVTVAGAAYCWGANGARQLGDNTTTNRNEPVQVQTSLTFRSIAAGFNFSCGLTTTGEVWCWGNNPNGVFGAPTPTNSPTPVRVPGVPALDGISASAFHVCGWTASGTGYCWGTSNHGRLGDGDIVPSNKPPAPVLQVTNFRRIYAGNGATCGVTTTQQAYCWGLGVDGRLGVGDESARGVPTLVPLNGAVDISSGGTHTCAVTSSGEAHCWGSLGAGQVGNGRTQTETQPVAVLGGPGTYARLGVGDDFACATSSSNVMYCWGENNAGQLARGDTLKQNRALVNVAGFQPVALSGGGDFACGILAGGQGYCWGTNSVGELGDGTTASSMLPRPVAGAFLFRQISAGLGHACGMITQATTVMCWGWNSNGQLGDGATGTYRSAPAPVLGLPPMAMVSAGSGGQHTCAVAADGRAFCWGRGDFGQLGDGVIGGSLTPVQIPITSIATITAGANHSCALDTAGRAWCWGRGNLGQVGDNAFTDRASPVLAAGGITFTSIQAGFNHTCGVATDGIAYCWGNNGNGQIGNGSVDNVGVPTPVAGGSRRFLTGSANPHVNAGAMIQAGAFHTCAITTDNRVYCWGSNDSGKLGNGTFPLEMSPVRVSGSIVFRSQ